jgi:hypothetical protein
VRDVAYIREKSEEVRARVLADEKSRGVAERVAREHNEARLIERPTHLVLSGEGWYPRLTDKPFGWPERAIVVDLHDRDITADEALEVMVELATNCELARPESYAPTAPEPRGGGVTYACSNCGSFVRHKRSRCDNCGVDPSRAIDGYVAHEHTEVAGPRVTDRQKRLRREHARQRRRR